jgi:hypothetical protein
MKINQISDVGTAATLDAGTAQNQVLKLDPDGKLPAIDGSSLTNVGGGGGGGDPATPAIVTFTTAGSNITIPSTYANGTVVYFDTSNQSTQIFADLPAASSFSSGYFLEFTRCGMASGVTAQNLILRASGSDTVGGLTTRTLLVHDAFTVVSDGSSKWYLMGIGGS